MTDTTTLRIERVIDAPPDAVSVSRAAGRALARWGPATPYAAVAPAGSYVENWVSGRSRSAG